MALIDATTAARVKSMLSKTDSDDDTLIGVLITAISQRIESFIDRPLKSEARTEEYDVHDGRQQSLFLRAYPVASITSIKNDPAWDWSNTTALDTDLWHSDDNTGEIHLATELFSGPKAVQVIYTAGMAADTAAVIAAYPAIAEAADLQVVATYRRRSTPQGKTVPSAGRGGSLQHEAALEFLPDVREALLPFRRMRFGV